MTAPTPSPSTARPGPRVAVIGAGFGGLGTAVSLLRAGIDDLVVLERAEEVGGVWRDNTYPGAACDVPSALYSWSFAPNPEWPRRYPAQPVILDYIRRVAHDTGVLDKVRTGVDVVAAAYDESSATWTLRTAAGEEITADVVVSAVGQLSNPVVPDLPGRESFSGPMFHSAQWRHDVPLAGKRVAVVGTGASAIQFVPGIVDEVGAMTVFQRSAPYIVPKPDRAYTGLHHRLFRRWPVTQRFGRSLTWVLSERLNGAITGDGRVARPLKAAFKVAWRAQLRRQVPDPALRRALRPDYPLGCKRILFSNDWYPALARPHVDVVTERVSAVEPAGVRTADGRLHEADVLIWGTGFAATEFLAGIDVRGAGGVPLHEVWADGAHAHLGITVPGFPNLFCVYGPNTNLGGSSILGMTEAQAGWIAQVVRGIADGRARAVAASPDVAAAFDREMQDRLADSAWTGCVSWYREGGGGRITTNWPGFVAEYQQRTAEVDWSELEEHAVAAAAEPAVSGR
ncbi:flavin-containing monooxygenase [Nocardioides ferulae]|uniref:flavin-containing monooxygenase n=1 Tax=Nocardioides ferulae TaxID=2340821 RepID=UPI001F0CABBE|nr:NAD(P)/FAD-dependent oxidoreductase [Nocardioides ferulae]